MREIPSDFCTYISEPDESIHLEAEENSIDENDSTIIQLDGNVTTISDGDDAYSVHSGSVNFEHMNGRRASICQLDGNQTMNSDVDSSCGSYINEYQTPGPTAGMHQMSAQCEDPFPDAPRMEPQAIPTQTGFRPTKPDHNNWTRQATTRKVVRRDKGLVDALCIPTISVYNMRSIWAKIKNLADDINMRGTQLCFLTEVWQKQESRRHSNAIILTFVCVIGNVASHTFCASNVCSF